MDTATSYNVWLLSPYHSGSHRVWATGYQRHSYHTVQLLTMPGRFWKWRMQGGAIELAHQARQRLQNAPPPDAIITTDMVNLPTWLGLMRATLPSSIPILYYMHENQLTYPLRPGEKPDLSYAMINWMSQLTADHIAFNSRYHADSWFAELPSLLKHFPDYNHLGLIDGIQKKSSILPVGIECGLIHERIAVPSLLPMQDGDRDLIGASQPKQGATPPIVLWNQRWEYDKNPKEFFACLYALQQAEIPFRLVVAGENFRKLPGEFHEARKRFSKELLHWGYVKSYTDYISYLRQADLVISTAIHEFFGISILEAITAGAFPLLPNRLSYPELIPEELHPACLYGSEEELIALSIQRLQMPRPAPPSLRQHVLTTYDWPVVASRYDALVARLIADK